MISLRCLNGLVVMTATVLSAPLLAQTVSWQHVANNADNAPGGGPGYVFRSYNQPAINDAGLVVFRARSSSGGQQIDGVYRVDPVGGVISKVLARYDTVPDPNNTFYNGVLADFTEFPSIPRIDANSALLATRGQSQPVWTYLLDGSETRIGTSGIYASDGAPAWTATSLLGAVVDADQVTPSFPWFSVPDAVIGTRFDQFPGAPTTFGGRYVAFKGNYTDPFDGLGKTGVYYRDIVTTSPVPYTALIASSNTRIPNQAAGSDVKFGATAPPSAAASSIYFTGWDNEDAPTMGGIYLAHPHASSSMSMLLAATPLPLTTIVGIGDQVPGQAPGETFTNFGEVLSLSSDGSQVAFWATWGTQTIPKILDCPTDGRPELVAYCNEQFPSGYAVDVPLHQGIFVYDGTTSTVYPIATTGEAGMQDFLFWHFSGRVPGSGSEDDSLEPARWRSSAFLALSTPAGKPIETAFQAVRSGVQGLYIRERLINPLPPATVAEVGVTPGTDIDPAAPVDSLVSSVGIERDGFRNGRMAITASMLYVDPLDPQISESWAGIYAGDVQSADLIFRDGFEL